MRTVYVSIGNSDDKLTQTEWSRFYDAVNRAIFDVVKYQGARIHGTWLSLPHEPWQNACWCFDAHDDLFDHVAELREQLRELATEFRQDSIAWAEVSETEFLCAG